MLHSKRVMVCNMCRFHPVFKIWSPQKPIFCDLSWEITSNYNHLDSGQCDKTGHRKMAVLGVTGDHGDNPWKNPAPCVHLRDQDCFVSFASFEIRKRSGFHIMMLFSQLNWISILSRISDWSVPSRIKAPFLFDWDLCNKYRFPIVQVVGD